MSREAWPIQIAIIGAEEQISDALQAFSGACCAAMDRPCRCAVFSDAESFAASARRKEYDVVFCGAGGDEALALLRGAAPRAGMILVSRDADKKGEEAYAFAPAAGLLAVHILPNGAVIACIVLGVLVAAAAVAIAVLLLQGRKAAPQAEERAGEDAAQDNAAQDNTAQDNTAQDNAAQDNAAQDR